jgi:hypothetical protein
MGAIFFTGKLLELHTAFDSQDSGKSKIPGVTLRQKLVAIGCSGMGPTAADSHQHPLEKRIEEVLSEG